MTLETPENSVTHARRLIRLAQVREMTGLSRSYIYQLSKQKRFPASIALVPEGSAKAWLESEVISWIDARISERDQEVEA